MNDYPEFITKVTPELERRLAASGAMARVTGRLRLDFYKKVEGNKAKGLEIVFEDGKIAAVRDWANPGRDKLVEEFLGWKARGEIPPKIFSAGFGPLNFHQLLLGDRSLEELIGSYGETVVKDETTKVLLNALFPRVSHHIDTFYW